MYVFETLLKINTYYFPKQHQPVAPHNVYGLFFVRCELKFYIL